MRSTTGLQPRRGPKKTRPNRGSAGISLEGMQRTVKRSLKALWGGIVCIFTVVLILVFWGANISSCVSGSDSTRQSNLKIIEVSDTNARHIKLQHALESVWRGATGAKQTPKLLIADSTEINAASFGSGRFLVWDGVADLPDPIVRAVFAHEVAHDLLRHSKKAQELKDLTDFFGDVLSVFGRADRGTENTLKKWVGYTALPKYSRRQEFQADEKAIQILAELGDDEPRKELSTALELLLAKYGNAGGNFFDSHPSTAERIQRLRSNENAMRK
jgi:Zn-dependent protease with chaperone function